MKETLSAFVDNELSEFEEKRLLKMLGDDAELRQTWGRYQLVRSSLRGEPIDASSVDLSLRIRATLEKENALTGTSATRSVVRIGGRLAIAASVAAVTLVAVQWARNPQNHAGPLAAKSAVVQTASAKKPMRWNTESPEAERTLNSYLREHNEFAGGGVSGMLPYVRVVGYNNNEK
jgi:sigma-E factor negative regulatory protein RseA